MKSNLKNKTLVLAATSLGMIGSVHAVLPADAQTAVDSISTFADDIIAAAWPIATVIVVASIGIKLFKKFSNKAT